MEKCIHQCYRCNNYRSYYIINGFEYEKTESGYCRYKRSTVEPHDSCEYYEYRSARRKIFEPLLAARLESLLREITVLRRLVEEESENDV